MKKPSRYRWLRWTVAIYLLGGIALYAGQDLILFRPVRIGSDQRYDFPMPHQDISIPVKAEDTLNLIRFEKTHPVTRGAVLYFHGNKRNISWYARYIPFFTRHGYEVYMIDYPGYGKSTGQLTEKKLYQWAALVYKLALKRFPADSLIIYGRSMGTGIAAQLASVRDCKRLILETPYYDFPSVVSDYLPVYPMNWLLRYQLPTHEFLDHVTVPVSIFHGTRDRVITFPHALRLAPHLKSGDEFIVVPGAHHNDLYKFSITIRKLDSLLTLP